ncbi:PepSY domain-containing protein [Streptomyces sp. NPDC086549]|uniref:PepSY domain-containing protein n=1 Tax=Streptomyces sp. NPDC086549 TaxID=3365752 RepID=UPI0037F9A013
MSQPEAPKQPESTPDSPVAEPKSTKSAKTFRARLPRVSRRRGAALGVVVLLAGAAATGVAAVVHHDHGEKGDHGQFAAEHRRAGGDDGRQRAYGQARGGRGGHDDEFKPGTDSQGNRSSQSGQVTEGTLAPAPLPAVSAEAAIEAAGKAVSGGKADALRVIAEQGGGSAWEVEVLGTDGVRHLVTIDGATGTVTGNTVAPATSNTAS